MPQSYRLTQTVAPTVEPVSLTEAKLHCRVDLTDEDNLLANLIAAAREHVESHTGRALIRRTYTYTVPVTGGTIALPVVPVASVTLVEELAEDGTATTISASNYVVSQIDSSVTVEQTSSTAEYLRITFTAGYGVAATPSATLTISGLPTAGSTVTIGSTVYTWRAALTAPAVAYEVVIGATAAVCAANLVAAITAGTGVGSKYSTGTVAHTTVTATQGTGSATHTVIASARLSGASGNGIAVAESDAQTAWSGATLAGGVPAPMLHAMLLLIGHLYANREAVASQQQYEVPFAVKALLGPYRARFLG